MCANDNCDEGIDKDEGTCCSLGKKEVRIDFSMG